MKVITVKVIAAASYFAQVSRKVEDISKCFGVDARTIRRWSEHELWEQTLDVLGYEGDRSFQQQPTRDVERDTGGLFSEAKEAYLEAMSRGEPVFRLARIAAERSGVDVSKVRDWAKKYQWRE